MAIAAMSMPNNPNAPLSSGNTVVTDTGTPNPEAMIDAGLLYWYVGSHFLPRDEWIRSLKASVPNRHFMMRHRIETTAEGKLLINLPAAEGCALDSSGTLAGAIALIIITEGWHEGLWGGADGVADHLFHLRSLVVDMRVVDARALHYFLEVKMDFEQWLRKEIRQRKLKPNVGYFHIDTDPGKKNARAVRVLPNGMMFAYNVAQAIAVKEPTPRGMKIRRCIEAFHSSMDTCNPIDMLHFQLDLLEPSTRIQTGSSNGPVAPKSRRSRSRR